MSDTTIFIDGVEIKAQAGQTILEAAEDAGVYIPRLCAFKDLSPYGVVGMAGNVSEWVGENHNPGRMGGCYLDDSVDSQVHILTRLGSARDITYEYVGFRAVVPGKD